MTAFWRQALPAVLLVTVAATQIVLSRTSGLSPWKGGGFGMFASLDNAPFRGVDIVIEAPERSEGLEIPPSLEELTAQAALFPADVMLARLAAAVAARERRYERPVTTVKLAVWRYEFDPVTLHATERRLRSFTWQVP